MSQPQRTNHSALWKFFDKTGSDYRAICSVCQTYVSYKSTTANLKAHLKRRHTAHYLALNNNEDPPAEVDRPEIGKKPSGLRPSNRRSPVWKYFTDANSNDNSKVKCKLCGVIYSLNEHKNLYSLKLHLKFKHNKEYLKIESTSGNGHEQESDVPDDDSVSNSSIKFATEILNYFEQRDDVSRCTLCTQAMESSVEEMKNHLEEEHPAVLISILNQKEVNTEANEETYTEIVYLEDEQKQTSIARKRRKTNDHQSTESKTATDSRPDIDSFLNYISVLLRNVPRDAMPKLQLDVISCVLNAQMNPVQNVQSKACNCTGTIANRDFQISVDLGNNVNV